MNHRWLALVITLAIGAFMAMLLVAVNRIALLLNFGSDAVVASATLLTLAVELFLFAIVWSLVAEILAAQRDRLTDNRPIPAILTGLLSLYVVVAWLFLATTLSRLGTLFNLSLLSKGYTEPESQIFRTLLILVFVGVSFYYFVWRYRARAVARWLWDWWEGRRIARAKAEAEEDETHGW